MKRARTALLLLGLAAAGCGSEATFDAPQVVSVSPGATVTTSVVLRTTMFARSAYAFAATSDLLVDVTVDAQPANTGKTNVVDTRGGIEKAVVTLTITAATDAPNSAGLIEVIGERQDTKDQVKLSIPITVE